MVGTAIGGALMTTSMVINLRQTRAESREHVDAAVRGDGDGDGRMVEGC